MNKFPTTRLEVDIELVYPNSWNPNLQSEKMFEEAKRSITNFGFVDPVFVREYGDGTYQIIDGEHRWKACKELGYTKLIIESYGVVDEAVAKILTMNMNKIRGEHDIMKEAALYKSLNENQLTLLSAEKKEIDNALQLLNFDFSQYENAEITEEEKQELKVPLNDMLKVLITLQRINSETKIEELQHLIIKYQDIVKAFEILCKEKKV